LSVELHLPDLPEVPLSLGAPPAGSPRASQPWYLRLREALSSYLPLLLMAVLALATWWLVKNAPRPPAEATARALASEPDVVMTRFTLQRFDAAGRLKLRVEGAEIKHFPDSDRVEIQQARIVAYAPDGRITHAQAAQVRGLADGSELFLEGGAEVISTDAAGQPLVMRGESLQAYVQLDRLLAPRPVLVEYAGSNLRANGLSYDHARSRLDLTGPVKAVLPPRQPPLAAPAAAAWKLAWTTQPRAAP
jgi:lipopolysaccharide export system protein LptC